jgi:hypothetical protein
VRTDFVLTPDSGERYRRGGWSPICPGREQGMTYERPEVMDFGSIADHTFLTPGGREKGCTANCHLDSFTENSALPAPS